jgi:L,D-transpeptidase YcbB
MKYLITASAILVCLYACRGNISGEVNATRKDTLPPGSPNQLDPSIPGNFSEQKTNVFDSTLLFDFLKTHDSLQTYRKDIMDFYRTRNYAYAWYDGSGLIEQSSDVYNRISNLSKEGLSIQVPYLVAYKQTLEESNANARVAPNPEIEFLQTGMYFFYASRVWTGIAESQSRKMEWMVPRKKLNYEQFLDSMLKSIRKGEKINEPVYRQYGLLREYLHRLQEIEQSGQWLTVEADFKKYAFGDSGKAVLQIRNKLQQTRDLSNNNGSSIFDTSLVAAVKSYQQRYGLKEDGIVGPAMIRELNAPLSKRMQQIIVNMERCRWVDADPRGNYLVVNIPQFKLMVYENDQVVWDCNVVVGEEVHKTVIFQGDMKTIVFSPYWNIPPGILRKETLPAIKRNPNYLARHNMEWNGGNVRQKPGPNNSLGLVKFLFPNSFNIYLHDSPAKSLFNEPRRTFSHGCVRVSEARKLAIYLLRVEPAWTEQKIDQAMKGGREIFVNLKESVPVSIVYFTAWVDRAGRINFRDDVYKRDARLMEAIFTKK